MTDHEEGTGSVIENLVEAVTEKIHHHDDSSSSSDSDDDKPKPSVSETINRLFGRKQPVHKILGGGKPADIFLWRNKKISAGILGGVTVVWLLFEWLGYYLLTLVCHLLILALAITFLWSNASSFINKSTARIPEVKIPEDVVVNIARGLTFDANRGFFILREVASGRDLKKFLGTVAGLWVLSIIGSWCNFLTLFYLV